MIVLTENLIKALNKTKEKNVYIMGLKFQKARVLDLLKANDNHETVELTTGKVSWHDITYDVHCESEPLADGRIENHVTHMTANVSDVTDKPCLQFYFNHEQPKITARLFELYELEKYTGQPKPFATIKFNTGHLTAPEPLTGIRINPGDLLTALNVIAPAMATEFSRPVLAAMYFECSPDKITLTAADGFRLATTSFNCETGMTENFLIEGMDIPKLVTLIKGIGKKLRYRGTARDAYESDVYLKVDLKPETKQSYKSGTVTFSVPGNTKTFHSVEGNFPQYNQLIPNDSGTSFMFGANTALLTIKPLKQAVIESSGIVRLVVSDDDTGLQGIVTASGRAEEIGDVEVKFDTTKPAYLSGTANSSNNTNMRYNRIAVNYQYLMDALKAFGDKQITAYLTTSSSPFKFVSGNLTIVMMPMFVQWETKSEPVPEPETIGNETDEPDNLDKAFDSLARERVTVEVSK